MAKLTATVIVRDPKTGEATPLLAGSDLPVWAKDLVGDHVLDKPAPAKRSTGDSDK